MKNKNLPKISIITPSFNQARFIERTIKSVVTQNYPNIEYIIKDAGSKDDSLEIIKKYAKLYPTIIKWISKKDKGQSDGINQGIKMSTGEIIAFLNSDDAYLPGTFKKIAKEFKENNEIMWISGRCRLMDENDKNISSWIKKYKDFLLNRYSYSSLLIQNYISQPSTFWRYKIIKEIGFFNNNRNYAMDYDYWLRIGKKYKLKTIKEDLAVFRIYSLSKGGSKFIDQFKEDLLIVKENTKNPFIILLHFLSNLMIINFYRILKS